MGVCIVRCWVGWSNCVFKVEEEWYIYTHIYIYYTYYITYIYLYHTLQHTYFSHPIPPQDIQALCALYICVYIPMYLCVHVCMYLPSQASSSGSVRNR